MRLLCNAYCFGARLADNLRPSRGIRSKLLIRLGLKFDEIMHSELFDSVFTSTLRNPSSGAMNGLQDMHIIRQFLTGGAIVALCDAPMGSNFYRCRLYFPPNPWIYIVIRSNYNFCISAP